MKPTIKEEVAELVNRLDALSEALEEEEFWRRVRPSLEVLVDTVVATGYQEDFELIQDLRLGSPDRAAFDRILAVAFSRLPEEKARVLLSEFRLQLGDSRKEV